MSRLPAPRGGWRESSEGDLDADLAEESESSLDDWREPHDPGRRSRVLLRVISAVLLAGLLASMLAAVFVR